MSEKTKKVQLEKAMTWSGVNYAPGLNEMPEAAANSAVKRKFGKFLENAGAARETGAETGFEALSLEETIKRMNDADLSDEVLDSLKVHRETIAAGVRSGKSLQEIVSGGDAVVENDPAGGLPEDFPMRHVFDKAGFKSVEGVQAKSREDLIAIDGIAERTADKALAYGK